MNVSVKDKFKNAWWFTEFCEKSLLAWVLYDFSDSLAKYRPLHESRSTEDYYDSYAEVRWDSTYDHQNKLTHAQLYEVITAAFELGFIQEAMEVKQILDQIHEES